MKRRIESILSSRVAHHLTFAKKALLVATSAAIVAGPVAIGALGSAQIAIEATQFDKAELKFDVVSIHRSDPNARNVRISPTPGGLRLSNVDLRAVVMFAYGVRPFQITGVPAWAEKERFDVVAKVDNASNAIDTKEASDRDRDALITDLKERTRSLLAERFQLALHRESKEGAVYNLIVAKGRPKMTASAQQDSGPQHMRMNHGQVNAERIPLQILIGALSDILGRPVVDRTGLTGNYDFSLKWTPDPEQLARLGPGGPPGPEPASVPLDAVGPTIFTALEEQLGLKLESAKGPLPVTVIDHAEKPSEN